MFGILSSKYSKNYPIVPFISSYSSGGVFGFNITSAASETPKLLQQAISDLKALATSASTADVDAIKTKRSLYAALSLEGEDSASFLLDAAIANVPPATAASYSSVTPAGVSAAAASTLKTTPAYAVLGTTLGTLSFTAVTNLLK